MAAALLARAVLASCDSNLHTVEPSSITSLHQRKPTINRPDTFLTVQKSKARSSTHTTKMLTKLDENQLPNMYTRMARALKRTWKSAGIGWLSPLACMRRAGVAIGQGGRGSSSSRPAAGATAPAALAGGSSEALRGAPSTTCRAHQL